MALPVGEALVQIRMPRILHLLDHSLPLHSGYSFRTAAIIREQHARGWTTLQLTSSKQGSAPSEEISEGLKFFRTESSQSTLARLPVLDQLDVIYQLTRRGMQIAREFRPDVLHAHSPCLTGLAGFADGTKAGAAGGLRIAGVVGRLAVP